ncbi:MAG: hypothetical protein OEL66_02055 [Desulfobulbaceae bacterium]|nr:hypothetical protein [Desulfobulbaceae bacterium]
MRTRPARELGMISAINKKLQPEIKPDSRSREERNPFDSIRFCRNSSGFAIPAMRRIAMILAVALTVSFGNSAPLLAETYDQDDAWSKRLEELNYLVMKTSAVNIIYGLNLTQEQATRLRALAQQIDKVSPPAPQMTGKEHQESAELRDSFAKLFEHILNGQPISDSLKKEINTKRLREVEIIKKSLVGAKGFTYSGKGCLACHAHPDKFPKGDLAKQNLARKTAAEQDKIDRAHIKGMFGNQGMLKLWEMKSEVDKVLTGTQKYMMRSTQCSLLPPDYLAHPTRIGQAVLTGNWYDFFVKIRAVPDDQWKTYRKLYTRYPFRDMLLAISPGIAPDLRDEIVAQMSDIAQQARNLDSIDYTLKRKELVKRINQEIERATARQVETSQQREARQFKSAMFLLFPGNNRIYNEYIRRLTAN